MRFRQKVNTMHAGWIVAKPEGAQEHTEYCMTQNGAHWASGVGLWRWDRYSVRGWGYIAGLTFTTW